MARTGNDALDVILTEKSLLCAQNDIKVTCIADGKALAFMSETDTYSLFGNALDNAIEALANVEDKEKRTIGLIVKRSGGFVSVHIYNYCPVRPTFSDGIPVTTKADKLSHGFGMASIRMIAAKYGGEMSASADDEMFRLDVLFPDPSDDYAA